MSSELTRRDLTLALSTGLALVGASAALATTSSDTAKKWSAFGPDFYDGKLRWYTVDGVDNLAYHILHVDEPVGTVDVLFKFAANRKIGLHRHKTAYSTLVLQGELRIYHPNGDLKEVRPTGSYVPKAAGGDPHDEGGGDIDVVVFFTNRGVEDLVYENLDDKLSVVSTFRLADFKKLFAAQEPTLNALQSVPSP